ncbi:MAG: response regulator transcription factor [Gammaproteobacteria bacterium]|jgi:DNA-binding NarL/FixJ family response regulator|nr:response regulator transcription factor [Gammaproteobacteria bacterium]MBQ0774447.1 response regulator transcription factor [Gammaproteobacteria bacterium]|tara:strand:- start:48132 stop:48788 length:657 start_codon:yes stop_codon:yes gene_type:complete
MTNNNYKVLLVDDHPAFSEGLSYILRSILGDDSRVLKASCAKQALVILADQPDIDWIFLDYRLPDMNGLQLLEHFNACLTAAPVIMLSAHEDGQLIRQALLKGASGFLSKCCDRSIIERCIRTVEQGETFVQPNLLQLSGDSTSTGPQPDGCAPTLSARQQEVLLLVSEGYSNREIAESLGISSSTVKSHLAALMELLAADNRSHCVAEARRLRLVVG